MARLPPSRHPLHCGLRIPDLRARDDSPLNRSCHQGVPAICLMRRLPAQSIRRCGLNATFRTRLQQCDGDWWPLSPRCYRVAHAARLGTDTEICDTVRLEHKIKCRQIVICAGQCDHKVGRCIAVHVCLNDGVSTVLKPRDTIGDNICVLTAEGKCLVSAC